MMQDEINWITPDTISLIRGEKIWIRGDTICVNRDEKYPTENF